MQSGHGARFTTSHGGQGTAVTLQVYENYNRFITATDTIRELKTNIDAASPSMTQLQDTSGAWTYRADSPTHAEQIPWLYRMAGLSVLTVLCAPAEEIERCREAVKAKLARRQAQVADLNEVQALLAKLEAVFQLPARLRAALDAKAYALAVDSYIGASPVLKRAGYKVLAPQLCRQFWTWLHWNRLSATSTGPHAALHTVQQHTTLVCEGVRRSATVMHLQGTLRRVAAEVEVQVRELTALLKERVMAQSDDAAECIGLIRRLGGPVADLQVPSLAASCIWIRSNYALRVPGPGCEYNHCDVTSPPQAERALSPEQQGLFEWPVRLHTGSTKQWCGCHAGRVPASNEGQPRRFAEGSLCSARALRRSRCCGTGAAACAQSAAAH